MILFSIRLNLNQILLLQILQQGGVLQKNISTSDPEVSWKTLHSACIAILLIIHLSGLKKEWENLDSQTSSLEDNCPLFASRTTRGFEEVMLEVNMESPFCIPFWYLFCHPMPTSVHQQRYVTCLSESYVEFWSTQKRNPNCSKHNMDLFG